jgi:hypothetical protein
MGAGSNADFFNQERTSCVEPGQLETVFNLGRKEIARTGPALE